MRSLECATEFLSAIREGMRIETEIPEFGNICIFAADECSIAGNMMSNIADSVSEMPIPTVVGYDVPGWVDGNTLSVVVWNSAEKEMSRVLAKLEERHSPTVCVAPVCTLLKAYDGRARIVEMPAGEMRAGFAMGALSAIVESAGIVPAARILSDATDEAERFLQEAEVIADNLAHSLSGRVAAVYGTSDITACAEWWKFRMDKDVGDISFFGELPEFDHNELVGWSDPNVHAKELEIVVLKGRGETEVVRNIVECMICVLRENGRRVNVVDIGGGSVAEMNLRGMIVGAMTASKLGGGS